MRGKDDDTPLLTQITGPVLATIVPHIPGSMQETGSVQVVRGLLNAYSVDGSYLGQNTSRFCCRDFLLAGGHLPPRECTVLPLYPDKLSAARVSAFAEMRETFTQLTDRYPRPDRNTLFYCDEARSVMDAVADGSVTPLPFPEAVAVHKRGGSTWPRVA